MKINKKTRSAQDLYKDSLQSVGGVKFTRRQVDVISCVIRGWGVKSIADCLKIAPSTVESHIDTITQKLGSSGRNSIITFIENSGKYEEFRAYYQNLMTGHKISEQTSNSLDAPPALLIEHTRKKRRRLKQIILGVTFLLNVLGFILFYPKLTASFSTPAAQNIERVHSDLFLPHVSVLLARPALMQQIDETLKQQKCIQTVVLTGIGGAGKTTLARQYARTQHKPVVWEVNAENRESLVTGFETLASRLAKTPEDKKWVKELEHLKDSQKRNKKFLVFVKKILRKNPNWILIYDNMEIKTFKDITPYLPQDCQIWGDGQVLITTRDTTLKNTDYITPDQIIPLNTLKDSEALLLFSKIYYEEKGCPLKPDERHKLKLFLKQLPPFPLDISTAAHYIKDRGISFDDYVSRSQKASEGFDKSQRTFLSEISDYTKTRYGIIALTLQNLISQNSDFQDLFLLMSLIDSQNIPMDLIKFYKGEAVTEQFIRALRKNSFITSETLKENKAYSTFSIHRSTQEIILNYLLNTLNLQKNKKYIKTIGKIFKNYIAQIINEENLTHMTLLENHLKYFSSHKYLLPPFLISFLNSDLGDMNIYLGKYNKAKIILERIIMAYQQNTSTYDPCFPRVLGFLGYLYMEEGNYNKAKKTLEQSLFLYEKNSFRNQFWFARILGRLGNVYNKQGKYQKAEQTLKKSLAIYKNNSLDNDSYFARSLGHLGNVYKGQGHYDKAKEFFKKSIAVYRKNSLEMRTWFGRILGRLGNVYKAEGNYKKAQQLLEHSIFIYKKNSLEYHPWFARSLRGLGDIYRKRGKYKEAEKCFQSGITIYKKNSFEEHPWFARLLDSLANLYREKGKYEKAEKYFQQSISIYQNNAFENHPALARIIGHLGKVYKGQGHYDKAKDLFERSIGIYKKNSFENHPWFAYALECLGSIYKEQGYYKIAIKLLKQSSAIYRKNSLENHPWHAGALGHLGSIFLKQGDNQKAKEFLEKSIAIYRKNAFEHHPHFARSLGHLGNLYREQGRYHKAEGLIKQSLEIYRKTYGEKHVRTAWVFLKKAALLLKRKKLPESEKIFQQALEIFKLHQHPNAYECFEGLSEIALKKSLRYAQEKNNIKSTQAKEKSLAYLKEALKIAQNAFPKDSAHTNRLKRKLKEINDLSLLGYQPHSFVNA